MRLAVALLLIVFALLSFLWAGGKDTGCTVLVILLIVVIYVGLAAWAVSLL